MSVTEFETVFRRTLADGKSFGDVGPYEEVRGTLKFAVDPEHSANEGITDVKRAPRNLQSRVEFSSDISIIRPVDLSRISGRMVLDVVNRGNRVALPNFNRALRLQIENSTPIDAEVDLGDGFLMEMGYVIVACGWQVDAPPQNALITMTGPEALNPSEARLRGKVYMQLQSPEDTKNFLLSDKNHKPYEAADMYESEALVEIRDMPDGNPETMPRDDWRFGRIDDDGTHHADPSYICSKKGFEKGRLYQVVYTTVGAPIIGLSFAALRDCVSWIKHGSDDVSSPVGGIEYAYAYGRSQTGRLLRTFVYKDFNLDEQGRETLDGIIANVAGGNRGEFNQRFGQNSKDRNNTMHQLFPFASVSQTDPETEETASLHSRFDERKCPLKVIYTNTSAEYHRGDASLIHTDPDGKRDIEQGDNTRVYHFAGTEHGLGIWPPTDNGIVIAGSHLEKSQNMRSVIDYSPFLRGCLVNLDNWVRKGIEPPSSSHPRIDDGTLIHPSRLVDLFSKIPGAHYPERHAIPRRRGFLPEDGNEHPSMLPPEIGGAYGGLVPSVNADGNETAGIVAPEISVPLATHTGWTLRHSDIGGESQLLMYAGGTIPFYLTKGRRREVGDIRPSIEERYLDRRDYVAKVRVEAEELVSQGYLLKRDIDISLELASRMWDHFVPSKTQE